MMLPLFLAFAFAALPALLASIPAEVFAIAGVQGEQVTTIVEALGKAAKQAGANA